MDYLYSITTLLVSQTKSQESREAVTAKKEKVDAMMREHKKAERKLIKRGKKPFHIKKCKWIEGFFLVDLIDAIYVAATQKKIELAEKYAKLKKSGKLEKFMSKKRKKNSSRDRKRLPSQNG